MICLSEAVRMIPTDWASIALFCASLFLIYVLCLALSAALSPLKDVPGPFLARFTRLWYFWHVSRGNFHEVNIELHKKYGPLVRIAPHQYSVDDPKAVKTIYGISSAFRKSKWYRASGNSKAEIVDLFTARDPSVHSKQRRKVANLYSNSTLVKLESLVDECIDEIVARFTEISHQRQDINVQFWMQCYAFDVIGNITCGEPFGFLKTGLDKQQVFAKLHNYLMYAANVGIYSELHKHLYPVFARLGIGGAAAIVAFAKDQITRFDEKMTQGLKSPSDGDFLTRLQALHRANPEKLTQRDLFATCVSNIGAGSDTTSISLTSILYQLMKNPLTLKKLRDEIDGHVLSQDCPLRVTFQEAHNMPYLQACIKEALRLHPATGLPLSREVPRGGATIAGQYFPQGEDIGINTWVAHHNTEVFGDDADVFRPERWLTSDKAQLLKMDEYFLTVSSLVTPLVIASTGRANALQFGHGSRTCIGKNISLLEMNKLIPILVKTFDIELMDPDTELKCHNVWFVKQLNVVSRVALRKVI